MVSFRTGPNNKKKKKNYVGYTLYSICFDCVWLCLYAYSAWDCGGSGSGEQHRAPLDLETQMQMRLVLYSSKQMVRKMASTTEYGSQLELGRRSSK